MKGQNLFSYQERYVTVYRGCNNNEERVDVDSLLSRIGYGKDQLPICCIVDLLHIPNAMPSETTMANLQLDKAVTP